MKILCKKHARIYNFSNQIEFCKHKFYYLDKYENFEKANRKHTLPTVYVRKSVDEGWRFRITENKIGDLPYLYDYFYTDNEIRKIKMERINEL